MGRGHNDGWKMNETVSIGIYNPGGISRARVAFTFYEIPKEWVEALTTAGISIPISLKGPPPFITTLKKDAIEVCQSYLQIVDRNWWPALLGKSEIMDEVLAEEFKK